MLVTPQPGQYSAQPTCGQKPGTHRDPHSKHLCKDGIMQRKNTGVLPVASKDDPALVTEPRRQLGGPQSGLPPAYEIASELAPFLIVGIDFGTNDCRVATFVDKEPRPLRLNEIESKTHFEGYATDRNAALATAFDVKTMLGKPVRVKCCEKFFDPIDLTVPVLQRVKRDAEQVSAKLLAKAVITTPACATHSYRCELLEAAEIAEIKVVGLLNETTALGLYWTHSIDTQFTGTFVAVSLGKTHWEAALLTRHEKLLEVRAHTCRPAPAVDSPLAEPLVIQELIQQLLDDSITDATDVKAIITGGRGGSEVFQLADLYRDVLPAARITNRLDYRAASAGAAIFAALIVRQTKDLAIWDCVANATMVGEEFSIKPLIAQQSPVPISGHFNFKATADKAQFQVVQRSGRDADARSVCCVVVEDIPATDVAPRSIAIEVHATADGILSFNARDVQLDSNLRIKVEPVATEFDVIELVAMEDDKQLDDILPAVDKASSANDTIKHTGVIVANSNDRWFIALTLPQLGIDLEPGMAVVAINGIPMRHLPENPNFYLAGVENTGVELIVKETDKPARTVALRCIRPRDAWDSRTLEPIVIAAMNRNDYAQFVVAMLAYGHSLFIESPEQSEQSYNKALETAQRELGTEDALFTLALARKAWFHLKRVTHGTSDPESTIKRHIAEMRRIALRLAGTSIETTNDAHAKYIFEFACSLHRDARDNMSELSAMLVETVIAIAEAQALPESVLEVYQAKLAQIRAAG